MEEEVEGSGRVGTGPSGKEDAVVGLAGSALGRSRVVARSVSASVGVGETAVIVGAGAWRGVGAVRAGSVGLEGEKW